MKRLMVIALSLVTSVAAGSQLFDISLSGGAVRVVTNVPNKTYTAAGIKINTPGVTLAGAGSQCQMLPNGYCQFSVSQTAPKVLTLSGASGTVNVTACLNAPGPASCQNYQQTITESHVYVVDLSGSSVYVCTIGTGGSLTDCESTGSGFSGPYAIAVNTLATRAYVTNGITATIAQCSIDSATKALTCSNYTPSPIMTNPVGVALNPDNTRLYVTDFGDDTVRVCSLSAGAITGCVDSGQIVVGPEGIVISPSNTYAYVVQNSTNSVEKCTIAGDGTFSACVDSGATGTAFNFPELISLNTAGTIAYVANGSGFVLQCPISPSTGNFGACTNVNPSFNVASTKQAVLNTSGTTAYVSDSSDGLVYVCTVNGSGGFSSCVDSGIADFVTPWGIAII